MKVTEIKENDDGSATYTFDMTETERQVCTEQGILWMIVAGVTGASPQKVFQEYLENDEL